MLLLVSPLLRSCARPCATCGNTDVILPACVRQQGSLLRVGGSLSVTRALGDGYLKHEDLSQSRFLVRDHAHAQYVRAVVFDLI